MRVVAVCNINNLYVQTLTQALPPQDTAEPMLYKDKIVRLLKAVDRADAVVLGIGSGASTAAGYDFYHHSKAFDQRFNAFERAHGFATLFDGLYHVFGTNEEQWAFNAAVIEWVAGLPVGQPYLDLVQALAQKDFFVLTSNVDGQVPRAFAADRVFEFQGDLRYLQCVQPCNDEVVSGQGIAQQLVAATQVGADGVPRVPSELLPRCEDCGWLMTPWVRDQNFLEGGLWAEQRERYQAFLSRHLLDTQDRVLFLELGVNSMTPAVIRLPFWDMVARNPQTFYVCVNDRETTTPVQLGDRAVVITADIARVTHDLVVG